VNLVTPAVWGSSIACSIGLCSLVTALAWPPPPGAPRTRIAHLAAVLVCLGSVGVGAAVVERRPLLALALLGLVLAAAAVVVSFVRTLRRKRRDDSDGGGGPGRGDDPSPPGGPLGGDGADWDWDAFEEQAHSAYRDSTEMPAPFS
jgi:uncharacterized membrane protein YgcG